MSETISELERLLCGPRIEGSLEDVAPRIEDAWDFHLPDLSVLPRGQEPWRKLRCCIATEDIAGPIRNGGIGTTYAALAELLAQLDHDSTILYLRGAEVETGDLEHWVEHYAAKGVRFVPVPDYATQEGFSSHADRWLRSPYNMMRYLQDNPMDVVHVSEWRGCGYFSLMAKRQGIAFANTLFVVKTSSPWMWNRLYGAEPVEKVDDLAKIHAERRSVELADIVVGGSLHLLRWMSSQGYRIPRGRAFVQPNVVSFAHLRDLLKKRGVERGARMPFNEIVFFGRLEGRKGLFVFCQAIERLLRQGVTLPPTITFMGKEGRRLTSRPDLTVLQYIAETTRDWPTKVKILTEYQQYQALDYLLDGPRLAVMPSVIENSSMAIYEAAICGVPCVASDVGGNMELVDKADWPHIFCKPHPLSLGDKLAEAIALGGYVPRPSFDNDANLETWRCFHDDLARGLQEQLLAAIDPPEADDLIDEADYDDQADYDDSVPEDDEALEDEPPRPGDPGARARAGAPRNWVQGVISGLTRLWSPPKSDDDEQFIQSLRRARTADGAIAPRASALEPAAAPEGPQTISVCIYVGGAPGALRATLNSIVGQTAPPEDIWLALDADGPDPAPAIRALNAELGLDCRVVEAFDLDAGAAFNRAAEAAAGSHILFLWEGATLRPDALAILGRVAYRRDADVLTYMHRSPGRDAPSHGAKPGALNLQLMSSVSDAFYRQDVSPAPVMVRRAAFEQLGGFTQDHRQLGHEVELMARAQLLGLVCETVMSELGGAVGPHADWLARRGYDEAASRFRVIRPLLAASPLAVRELMLTAKGLQARAQARPAAKAKAPRPDDPVGLAALGEKNATLKQEKNLATTSGRKSP